MPVLILVLIAIPSFRLLRNQFIMPKADITIKATGHAWYWEYEYPADQGGGFKFDATSSTRRPEAAASCACSRPTTTWSCRSTRSSAFRSPPADVLHSFAMPSFGIKIDAIPGRLNETWFKAEREGVYHGQCSELCGQRHAYMPITIRVVSEAAYAAWLEGGEEEIRLDRRRLARPLADAAQ